jgi:hypothetical protein
LARNTGIITSQRGLWGVPDAYLRIGIIPVLPILVNMIYTEIYAAFLQKKKNLNNFFNPFFKRSFTNLQRERNSKSILALCYICWI